MKKSKFIFSLIIVILFVLAFPLTVSANSSWHWISSKRPLDLLPIVIIITLLTEIAAVNFIAKAKCLRVVVPVVSLANLASFLVPYIWVVTSPDNAYSGTIPESGLFYVIDLTTQRLPIYTVSIWYLLITLFVETPVVYLFLRKKVPNKKVLIVVIIIANIVTTALTYAAEKIFCYGEW